jgi:hypothetical protein
VCALLIPYESRERWAFAIDGPITSAYRDGMPSFFATIILNSGETRQWSLDTEAELKRLEEDFMSFLQTGAPQTGTYITRISPNGIPGTHRNVIAFSSVGLIEFVGTKT